MMMMMMIDWRFIMHLLSSAGSGRLQPALRYAPDSLGLNWALSHVGLLVISQQAAGS
jgi:hypothetical protein